jgi:hypothetical protein
MGIFQFLMSVLGCPPSFVIEVDIGVSTYLFSPLAGALLEPLERFQTIPYADQTSHVSSYDHIKPLWKCFGVGYLYALAKATWGMYFLGIIILRRAKRLILVSVIEAKTRPKINLISNSTL